MKSSSSVASLGIWQKFKEGFTFLRWRFAEGASLESTNLLLDGLNAYREIYERATGRSFVNARTLEIGYGARPRRLVALMSMGIDIRGIDLDRPVLRLHVSELVQVAKKNGIERAFKSGVRSLVFDRKDWKKLKCCLEERGYKFKLDESRFLVGDAASFEFGRESFDFIFSDDVFEHIPPNGLETLVKRMATQISPNGLAVITPNVFTGISGGHLVDWSPYWVDQDRPRQSEPWEHLRQQRFHANTYLNKMSRADYREVFSRHFVILEEHVLHPDLGRRWLTSEVRHDLSNWDDQELFSNNVRFVLGPKDHVRMSQ